LTMTTADLQAVPAEDGPVSPRSDLPRRRVFTAEYKLAVVAEYDAAEPGQKGAILRREGLYSSHVVDWRRARDTGALAGLDPPPRTAGRSAEQVENARLKARAERAERKLAKTRRRIAPFSPGSAASYSAKTASLYWAGKTRRRGRSDRGLTGPSSAGPACRSAVVIVNVVYPSRPALEGEEATEDVSPQPDAQGLPLAPALTVVVGRRH
jgi:transposase